MFYFYDFKYCELTIKSFAFDAQLIFECRTALEAVGLSHKMDNFNLYLAGIKMGVLL